MKRARAGAARLPARKGPPAWLLAALLVTLLTSAPTASAASSVKVTIEPRGERVEIVVTAPKRWKGQRAVLERRAKKKAWTRVMGKRLGKNGRAVFALAASPMQMRVRILRKGGRAASSRVFDVRAPRKTRPPARPAPGTGATSTPSASSTGGAATPAGGLPRPSGSSGAGYTVPATTRVLAPQDVTQAAAGATADQAVVSLATAKAPPLGGHVALQPSSDFPDGMFAEVVGRRDRGDGTTELVLRQASIDSVLGAVTSTFAGAVTPTIVDANGIPVAGQAAAGRLELRGGATIVRSLESRAASSATSMFVCSGASTGGDLWTSGNPLPISVSLENTHAVHNFDAGSIFPARDPSLLLQFSGEAVAAIEFEAKTSFDCELSPTWRRNHRWRFPAGSVGGIPVSINLEPSLQFGVDGGAKVGLAQRHYFAVTFDQRGFSAPSFRLATSSDPPTATFSASVNASLFAGGDLSIMAGGGYKSANAQAGIYGAFGPKFALTMNNAQPDCVSANVSLEASFGVRLELWVKRWNYELASLSTKPKRIAGPFCGLPIAGDDPRAPKLNKVQPVDRGTKLFWKPPAAIDELTPIGVRCEYRDVGTGVITGNEPVSECPAYTYLQQDTLHPSQNHAATTSPGYALSIHPVPGRQFRIRYVYDGVEGVRSKWVGAAAPLPAPELARVAPVDGGTKLLWTPPPEVDELTPIGVRCQYRDVGSGVISGNDPVSECPAYTYLQQDTLHPSQNHAATTSPGYALSIHAVPGRQFRIRYVYDGVESEHSDWVTTPPVPPAPTLDSVAPVDGGTKLSWSPPPSVDELSPIGVRCEYRDVGSGAISGSDPVSRCPAYTYLQQDTAHPNESRSARTSPGYALSIHAVAGRQFRIIYVYDGVESEPSNWRGSGAAVG